MQNTNTKSKIIIDSSVYLGCACQSVIRNLEVCGLVFKDEEMTVLKWALLFLVLDIIAWLFAFRGVKSTVTTIARTLFFLFLIAFVVLLIMGIFGSDTPVQIAP